MKNANGKRLHNNADRKARNGAVLGLRMAVRTALAPVSAKVSDRKVRKLAARNGAVLGLRTALAPVSAEVSDQKIPKPEARNAVLIDPDLVNPAMARKVLRFGANNLMANRAVARAAKKANPAMAPKASKPVAHARRTADLKADLSRIAVIGVPAAKPVQAE